MRRSLIAVCAILGAATFSLSAHAQALFLSPSETETGAASALQRHRAPQVVRERLVRIDAAALRRHVAPERADNDPDRATKARALDGVVVLNLFDDVTATFRRSDVSERDGGGYIWQGYVNGRPFHDALLLVRNGQVIGRVQLLHKIYKIERVSGSIHRIVELDASKAPPEGPPQIPPASLLKRGSAAEPPAPVDSAEATVRAKTPIRILVAYTNAAAAEAGGDADMVDTIETAVASANQAFGNGRLPFKLVLAGTMKVTNYNEGAGSGNDYVQNLNDVTSGAAFSGVRAERNARSADLVSLFRKDPGTCNSSGCICGLGWMPGIDVMPTPSAATADTGFTVLAHNCVPFLSFQHEIGHNMGLQHDRFQYRLETGERNPPRNKYNFGFTNKNQGVIDIMAYTSECDSRGINCTRVNYFSSATIKAQPGDVSLGISAGQPNAADATKRLKANYLPVSAYR